MAHAIHNENIKYTTVLPSEYVNDLKLLVSEKVISSVNQGIRVAIEEYLAEKKREIYLKHMQEAAQDKQFMERTLSTQTDFENVDAEGMGKW